MNDADIDWEPQSPPIVDEIAFHLEFGDVEAHAIGDIDAERVIETAKRAAADIERNTSISWAPRTIAAVNLYAACWHAGLGPAVRQQDVAEAADISPSTIYGRTEEVCERSDYWQEVLP